MQQFFLDDSLLQLADFTIDIPHLDPSQPLLLFISPDQEYHKEERFKALLLYLYAIRGLRVIIIVGDGLKRFNFQVERANTNEDHDEINYAVDTLFHTWQSLSLNFDQITVSVSQTMIEEGRLEIFRWQQWKTKYATEYARAETRLTEEFQNPESRYHKAVRTKAKLFFNSAMAGKYQGNDTVKSVRRNEALGDAFITERYECYVKDESNVFAASHIAGWRQAAYPRDYVHRVKTTKAVVTKSADSKAKTSHELWEAIKEAVRPLTHTLMDEWTIRYAPRTEFAVRRTAGTRKGSLDSVLAEKLELLELLRAQEKELFETQIDNASLREENSNYKRQLLDKDATIQKLQNEKLKQEAEMQKRGADMKRREEAVLKREREIIATEAPKENNKSKQRHLPCLTNGMKKLRVSVAEEFADEIPQNFRPFQRGGANQFWATPTPLKRAAHSTSVAQPRREPPFIFSQRSMSCPPLQWDSTSSEQSAIQHTAHNSLKNC